MAVYQERSTSNYREGKSKTWICSCCLFGALPFHRTSNFDPGLEDIADYANSNAGNTCCSDLKNMYCSDPNLLLKRKKSSINVLVAHLNINSLQNKIEELKELKGLLKAQILFLAETKLDNT